jgi:uncharacterized lipoprotein YddW (UPF0748 family)
MRFRSAAVVAAHLITASGVQAQLDTRPATPEPPPIAREFRGVWVATVGNRDWPSEPGLPVEDQQAELIRILDVARGMHLNAVILQVRPAADAIYPSKIEPWSEFLTGAMGRSPSPDWDPLAFAIEEAHRRGLELHAWFNPFRARYYNSNNAPASAMHISKRRPDLVKRYGPYLWLDPGSAEARAYSLRVISDVVNRYDIDGVHIDDYFYPYLERDPRTGRYIQFPDDKTYRGYVLRGGKLSRADWRRSNINGFVAELYSTVKSLKPAVKVGISPFGIWRPGYPESVDGLDSYTEIFADSRKWLTSGWLDYIVPQLYWRIGSPQQSYVELLNWWVEQNTRGRHVFAGNAPYRVANRDAWPASEIVDQITLTRMQLGALGNLHFSMSAFLRMPELGTTLAEKAYTFDALVPESRWLDTIPPAPPSVRIEQDSVRGPIARLAATGSEPVFWWGVRMRYGTEWTTEVLPATQKEIALQRRRDAQAPDEIAVTAVDRNGLESTLVRLPTR